MTTTTPSAVAVLTEARDVYQMTGKPWHAVAEAAERLGASACAEVVAGNALDTAMKAAGCCNLAVFDTAIEAAVARRRDLDTWLASHHIGRTVRPVSMPPPAA